MGRRRTNQKKRRYNTSRRLQVQSLERRDLLAASVLLDTDGTLTIDGREQSPGYL